MHDPWNAAERYRKDAAEFSDQAKSAPTQFLRDYYQRLAERYLLHAENQLKLAKIEDVSTTGSSQRNGQKPRSSRGLAPKLEFPAPKGKSPVQLRE